MGMIIFDLRGHGGFQRPKTSLRGQKWHEGVDLLKKYLIKVFQQPQNPLAGPIRFELKPQGKKI